MDYTLPNVRISLAQALGNLITFEIKEYRGISPVT